MSNHTIFNEHSNMSNHTIFNEHPNTSNRKLQRTLKHVKSYNTMNTQTRQIIQYNEHSNTSNHTIQ